MARAQDVMQPTVAAVGAPRGRRRRHALARYVAAATLARGADAGAAVGLVLLAVDPATGIQNGPLVGGLLAAGLTAPHLLGPWTGRRLDAAHDGRRVLALAFAWFGLALAAAAASLGRAPLALAATGVLAAGVCGPLLTGGLSSRLVGIAGAGRQSQRRAEGWDAVSYGLSGTAGPTAVAALAALTRPLLAVLVLAGAAVAAAVLTMTLPHTETSREEEGVGTEADGEAGGGALSVRAALRVMATCGPLRRVTLATMLSAAGAGALPVVAVVFASALHAGGGAGPTMMAALGLGNLAGSLVVTAFPLRGEPERLVAAGAFGLAVVYALCALAPSYPFALGAFALAGVANAPFFTATLASRSEYAPSRARAQVFVSSAGLKVAAAAAGTALAGAASAAGPRMLLTAAAVLTLSATLSGLLDRRLTT